MIELEPLHAPLHYSFMNFFAMVTPVPLSVML
jgi:hypothetical protein